MREGEDQHRQDEEDALDDAAVAIRAVIEVKEAVQVPARDEVNGGDCQRNNQRVDQHLGQPDHRLSADGEGTGHHAHAKHGQKPPVERRPTQLVDNEAIHRVGDGDTVDEDGGKDRDPVQHREDDSLAFAQILGDQLEDVFAVVLFGRARDNPRIGAV